MLYSVIYVFWVRWHPSASSVSASNVATRLLYACQDHYILTINIQSIITLQPRNVLIYKLS